MKKYLKITLLVVIAIILVGTFVFLYQKSKPKVITYEIVTPEVTDLQKTTVATGKVEPRDEILIKPQISGIIDEVYKEAGQAVKKGEVIAKVKVIPELGQLNSAESRVRLAEINATQAETDFARVKKLYEDQLISREEYEKIASYVEGKSWMVLAADMVLASESGHMVLNMIVICNGNIYGYAPKQKKSREAIEAYLTNLLMETDVTHKKPVVHESFDEFEEMIMMLSANEPSAPMEAGSIFAGLKANCI